MTIFWAAAVIETLALISLLIVMYGIIGRGAVPPRGQHFAMGALFGVATVYSMSQPFVIGDGVILDMRALLVGSAGALIGPVAGLVAAAAGVIFRIHLGGQGTTAGVVAIGLALMGGLVWRYLVRPRLTRFLARATALGLMISAHLFALFLLPEPIWRALIGTVAPFYLVADVLGVIVIKMLILRERGMIIETESLRQVADSDPLTGVPNRRKLEDTHARSRRETSPMRGYAFICLDLDGFKQINDEHGHHAGDIVLGQVVRAVRGVLRYDEQLFRLGGDEFLVFLSNVNVRDAREIAHRCRDAVASLKVAIDDVEILPKVSVGCSWQPRLTTLEEDCAAADAELYRAKREGKNVVSFRCRGGLPDIIRPAAEPAPLHGMG